MTDEAKLGLMAGVLAVVGVAAFAVPRESSTAVKPEAAITNPAAPPSQPPAAVNVGPPKRD